MFAEYMLAKHRQDASAASGVFPGKNGDVLYRFHSARAADSLHTVWNTFFPYMKREKAAEPQKTEAEALAERYRKVFGK